MKAACAWVVAVVADVDGGVVALAVAAVAGCAEGPPQWSLPRKWREAERAPGVGGGSAGGGESGFPLADLPWPLPICLGPCLN